MGKWKIPLAVLITASASAGLGPAASEPRGAGYWDQAYITVGSRTNPGQTVSAPVRRMPNGRAEVKLPDGPWVDCGGSCYGTLRSWALDFWDIEERLP